jgi:hypothetical protein
MNASSLTGKEKEENEERRKDVCEQKTDRSGREMNFPSRNIWNKLASDLWPNHRTRRRLWPQQQSKSYYGL